VPSRQAPVVALDIHSACSILVRGTEWSEDAGPCWCAKSLFDDSAERRDRVSCAARKPHLST